MEPTTVAMIAKAAITLGTAGKKVWTGIMSVVVGVCIFFVLVGLYILNIVSAGVDYNRSVVDLVFERDDIPISISEEDRKYIFQMQESFGQIDAIVDEVESNAEEKVLDRYLVKAVFFSLYYGDEQVHFKDEDYRRFIDCFVTYEENTRTITDADGTVYQEKYQAVIAITDKVELFSNLKSNFGKEATYEQQANAMNIWYIAKYESIAPTEGDQFEGWMNWSVENDSVYYELSASEVGEKVVELAMSRLGHPYSQTYRGKGTYVDCSYLTMWCYKQVSIILPGTAAEQGKYMVENNLTISQDDLQPGDLVFWSYKPNGRFMNITHVGIYAGDGKVVDASYSKGKVVYRNLFDEDKQVLYGRPQ